MTWAISFLDCAGTDRMNNPFKWQKINFLDFSVWTDFELAFVQMSRTVLLNASGGFYRVAVWGDAGRGCISAFSGEYPLHSKSCSVPITNLIRMLFSLTYAQSRETVCHISFFWHGAHITLLPFQWHLDDRIPMMFEFHHILCYLRLLGILWKQRLPKHELLLIILCLVLL